MSKKQNTKHKVSKKDLKNNDGALEKAGLKEGDEVKIPKQETKKSNKVKIEAIMNTTLADGTFIKKGNQVEVDKEYAERIKQENNQSFKIIN